MGQELSIAQRLDAQSFPHPITHLQCRETPISWVLLTGPYAYKIKKPVRLPFIDASTLERRRLLCEQELRLNQRYTDDLYLDVLPISERHGRLHIGAAGTPVEYAVRMREFAASQELAQALSGDGVSAAEMAEFGARLAGWHDSSACAAAADPYGSVEVIDSQVQENFATLRASVATDDAERLSRLALWTHGELGLLSQLLRQRRSGGRVRECHGDLHAGNIVRWHDQWVPFDCLEFEPRLRWIDVISDAAFLFMDLHARAHEELAYAFLSGYLEHSGDYQGLRLLPFYSVYRALVRAKIAALSSGSTMSAEAAASTANQAAARDLAQRLRVAEQLAFSRTPALLLMHGVTASGKSFLSSRLIGALGAVRVRSDVERRRLFGAGDYSAPATAATYERLEHCAQSALEAGYRVIVDATFLERARREAFERLARRCACPFLIVACSAPHAILQTRVAARARAAEDASEATAAVLERQLERQRPFEASECANLISVDTSSVTAVEHAIARIRAQLRPPPGS